MPSAPDTHAASAPGEGAPRVTLIGKPGCHLCDDARAVIETVTAELGESFVERSVLDEPELMARYAEEIPVTLVDGRQHDFWRVDADRLRAALARPPH
ncbi:glutaredoxin family protein [Rothia sp. ARF10]|nr:glutaredoxin family protein [Rothia sp. ARF10]